MSETVEPDAPQPDPALDASADGGESAPPAPPAEPDGGASRRPRHPFYLRGRRLWLPSTRRGLFAMVLVLGGIGLVGVYTAVSLITWTETADFCGRCHTMAPELQAYEAGPHRSVD